MCRPMTVVVGNLWAAYDTEAVSVTVAEATVAPPPASRISMVIVTLLEPTVVRVRVHERVVPRLSHEPTVPELTEPLVTVARTS